MSPRRRDWSAMPAAQVGRLAPVIAAIVAPAGASAPNIAELRRAVRRQDWHLGDFHPVVFDPTNEDSRLTWEKLARAGLGALGLGVLRRPRGDAAYMERLRASMREDDPDAVRALYAAVLAFLGGDVHALDEWGEHRDQTSRGRDVTGSRIGKVKVENFRGIRKQQEFDLSADVILAVGPNGSGKSTLAQVAAVVTTKRWISGIKETPTPRQPGSDDGFVIESTERGEEQLGTLSSPDQRRDDLFFFGDETPKGRLPDLIQSLAGGTHTKIQELARALLVAKGRLVSHDESLDRALRSTPRKRLESERSRLAAELQTTWPPPESGFPIPLGLRLRNGNLPPNWEAILSNLVVDARRAGWLEPALAEEPPLESLTHLSDPNRQTSPLSQCASGDCTADPRGVAGCDMADLVEI
jgi:hypothetical protein